MSAGAPRPPEPPRAGAWTIAARQLASPLIALLGVAALLSVSAGEAIDAVVIAAIVAVNGTIGFVQESRAEAAALGLRWLLAPQAHVVREGRVMTGAAEDLVPGDVVLLRAGDRVPADGRLVHASDVEADESSLTGESLPDAKRVPT